MKIPINETRPVYLMAYHTVIEFIKNQAQVFDINQEEIDHADIEPEQDLI